MLEVTKLVDEHVLVDRLRNAREFPVQPDRLAADAPDRAVTAGEFNAVLLDIDAIFALFEINIADLHARVTALET